MEYNTKTSNISLTPAMSEYVSKRMEKITKLLDEDTSVQCDVELAKTSAHHQKGDIFKAEIHIVGSGRNIYASSEKEELSAAVDDAVAEALRGLKSGKDKYLSFVRRGGATVKAMVKGIWPSRKPKI